MMTSKDGITMVKVGAIGTKLYTVKNVAALLGITGSAVNHRASVAKLDDNRVGNTRFFTTRDIDLMRLSPGRGRPVGSGKKADIVDVVENTPTAQADTSTIVAEGTLAANFDLGGQVEASDVPAYMEG